MTSYKAALTFKREFDHSQGSFENVFVQSQEQTDDNVWRFVVDSHKVRVFTGTNVEELLFTKEMFIAVIDVLRVVNEEVINEFTKCLNQDMLAEWNKIKLNTAPPIPNTRAGFNWLIKLFINFFAPDPDAKQTMITALEQKKHSFYFPHDKPRAYVVTFTQRMSTIF